MIWDTEHWANPCYTFPHSWTVLFYFLKTWPAYISLNLIPQGTMSKLLYFTNKKCMDVCNVWMYELNCPCTVDPHKGLHFDLPNKSLKQCLHDEVWLSNYNQQCHMGPAKLESNKKVHTITFTNIFIPIYSNSQFYMTLCALGILAPLTNYDIYAPKHFSFQQRLCNKVVFEPLKWRHHKCWNDYSHIS